MKKQVLIPAGFFMLLSLTFSACKKENGNRNVTSAFFENTIWLGEFDGSNAYDQPVSIEFKDNGRLSWHDISGESLGSWNVENNMVNVSIAGQGSFRANVSNDNKLTDIQRASDSKWTKVSAALDTTAELPLIGTTWEGENVALGFSPLGRLDIWIGQPATGIAYVTTYTQKAKTVRFTIYDWQWFLINNGISMLKGANHLPGDSVHTFTIAKK